MATQFSLTMSVATKNWRLTDGLGSPKDMVTHKKIFERWKFACVGCGFVDRAHLEVHHLDGDHKNDSPENLVPICHFCHLTQHIGLAGKNGEATIIWLPEIEQAALSHVARTVMVARYASTMAESGRGTQRRDIAPLKSISIRASSVMNALQSREAKAQEQLGTTEPLVLASAMQKLANESRETYDKRDEYLFGLRLLPYGRYVVDGVDIADKIVADWMAPDGAYANNPPMAWMGKLGRL